MELTIAAALADAAEAEVVGPAVTPYVLARIAVVTAGDSVPANLALAEHNAAVAGAVAVAVSSR
jgi:pseudouridine-5'-phosphate glycosidase